ncbi:MAG: hypothetical protein QOJ10_1747 [Chloroflexota bacterium]|jgi:hypothetical protein|nr:hypothetical protein [Chloroflexota bacterium]
MLVIGAVLLVCTGCAGAAQAVDTQAPPPTRTEVERLILRADDIKRQSEAGTPGLAEAFRGRALQILEAQAQALGRRGQRAEERNATRDLVHWDPLALEAVLQVAAQRRFVTTENPDPGWAATVRQWWVRFEFVGGRWWIADQRDLPPDAWRPVVTLTGWVHGDI